MANTGRSDADASGTIAAMGRTKWRLLLVAGALIVAIAGVVLAVALSTGSNDTATEVVSMADDGGSASTTTEPEPTTASTATSAPEDTTTTSSPSPTTTTKRPTPTTAGGGSGPPPAPMTSVAPVTVPPPPPPVLTPAEQLAKCIADQEAWGRTQMARLEAQEQQLASQGITPTPEQQARFTELRYEANLTISSASQFCHLKLGL